MCRKNGIGVKGGKRTRGKKNTTCLFLASLTSRLSSLTRLAISLLNSLDDTNSNSLTHVTHGETTERGVLLVRLNAHGLGRDHLDDSNVTRLDKLGVVFHLLVGTTVKLLKELSKLAGNVGSVAIKHWRVAGRNLTWVVQHNDLGSERGSLLGGVVLGVRADVTTTNVLDRHVLDVETNVVAGNTLSKSLVVLFCFYKLIKSK